jgi:2'-5' RNA ligase
MSKTVFFIGICPPHPLEKEIHGLKEKIRQKHGVQGGFRSNAHITLQMPFNMATKKVDAFISDFKEFLEIQNPIEIKLNDFGNFEPRVVFIKIVDNTQLDSLQESVEKFMKQFQVFNSTHKNNGFHPHITIAFRDLKKPTFYKIWNEFKERQFQAAFLADSVTIFKHNGKSWDVFKELKLGKP